MFISIDRILRGGGSYDNIEMLPGDQIIIPTKDMTVEIRLANTEAETYGSFSMNILEEVSMWLTLLAKVLVGM